MLPSKKCDLSNLKAGQWIPWNGYVISSAMLEGMCKPNNGNQDFPHCPKEVYFIVIVKKRWLRNGNRPIIKMGVAIAFEQYVQVISSLAIFINIWVYALHPVAMKIGIAQHFSVSFINIWVHALFLEKLIMLIMKTEKHPVTMKICMYCAGFFCTFYQHLSLCTIS